MSITTTQENESSSESMEARYERAQTLLQGMYSTSLVRNSTVFPNWIEGSNCFWYERQLKSGREYRLVDAIAKSNKLAFDHAAFAQALAESSGQDVNAEDLPVSIHEIDLDPVSIKFHAFEKVWTYHEDTVRCESDDRSIVDGLVSPNGRHALFIRDYNLWVHDLTTGEKAPLTEDGEKDFVYAVQGEVYAAVADPWGEVQAVWSPDSQRVFCLVRDTREVKSLPIVQHVPLDGSIRPTVSFPKIAYPSDTHVPEYQFLAIELATRKTQRALYPAIPVVFNGQGFFNIHAGWWANDSRRAYFIDVSRDHRVVRLVEFNTLNGDTRIILTETSETHVNLSPSIYEIPMVITLPETNEVIWWSERSGYGHLYLYDLDTGTLKNTITSGDWLVRDIVYFDPVRREVFIQTGGRSPDIDPCYRDLCRVPIDSGELVTLIRSDHEYFASYKGSLISSHANIIMRASFDNVCSVSHEGNFAVVTRSRTDEAPLTLLVNRDGKSVMEVEHADISDLPADFKWPEPVRLQAADSKTDIYGLIYRPSDFDPSKSYPVLLATHNCPDMPYVPKGSFTNEPFFGNFFFDQLALAELGFVVVQIDGRGLPHRSKAFLDECYGKSLAASNIDDQVAGIRQLALRYPYLDLDRVGVACPISGPGAVLGLLKHPDFFKVGVSAVQHDPRLLPGSVFGNKFDGVHGQNVEQQYPEELAENLEGKLLLMHGMLDPGNAPAIFFRLIDALQKANKDFDMLTLPNSHHGITPYLVRRMWDYLVTHLLQKTPPKEFNLQTSVDMNQVLLAMDSCEPGDGER